ncbi:MAG: iron-containing alcohol dehydrogenase [Terriglobia bacterium]
MITTFAFPTQIVFGSGAVNQIGERLAGLGKKRPLIVTDAGVVKAGLLERVLAPLKSMNLESVVFDQVEPNPTENSVHPGVEVYHRASCDCIVAVGGGSPLDAAKAIRLKTTHALPLEQYDDLRDGWKQITADLPPMLAVATTSGTGSEVSRSTVITLKSTGRKTVIYSQHLMPTVAIDDPDLTLGLPPHLTAATGMDAMTHNLEAYLSTPFQPICDAIALRGVELASRYLRAAVQDGRNLEARTQMMMASIMGAIAFQKGLGSTHSLAHPLSTVAGLHHGLSNAVMLPHVMRFNLSVVESRLVDLAAAMGIETHGLSTRAAAQAAIEEIEKLNADIGIKPRLRDHGVSDRMFAAMASKAMEDGCRLLNPRPTDLTDMEQLYRQAY